LLGQLDAPFPADFKLKEIIQYHDRSFHPWGEDESQESSNPGAGTPNESPTPLEAPTEDSSSEEPTATDGENPDDGNTTDEG